MTGPKRYVDEADQRRDLDERTDYRGKGLARGDTEGRNGHRDSELEVVPGRCERERGSLFVVEAQATGEPEGEPEHHGKVHEQRQRDPKHVQRKLEDTVSLHREHQHDGVEEPEECRGSELRHENVVIPRGALLRYENLAREEARDERHTEEDHNAFGDLAHGHMKRRRVGAEPMGHHGEEKPAEDRVGQDLKDGVERDQHRSQLPGPAGQGVPYQHHGDTPCETDQHESVPVRRHVRQEKPGEAEHDKWAEDPVQEKRRAQELRIPDVRADGLIAHLGEHGVHHPQQADSNRNGYAVQLHTVEQRAEVRVDSSEENPEAHRREDPEWQKAIERRKAPESGRVGTGDRKRLAL